MLCCAPSSCPATMQSEATKHAYPCSKPAFMPFLLKMACTSAISSGPHSHCAPTLDKQSTKEICSMLASIFVTKYKPGNIELKPLRASSLYATKENPGINGAFHLAPMSLSREYSSLDGRSAIFSSLGTRSSHKCIPKASAIVQISWIKALWSSSLQLPFRVAACTNKHTHWTKLRVRRHGLCCCIVFEYPHLTTSQLICKGCQSHCDCH